MRTEMGGVAMPIFGDNRTRRASPIRRLLVGMAAGLLAAVSAAAGAAPVTVRVGIAQAASDAPFFIADKKGYFAEEGIRVDYTVLTDMVPSLATGQLDVGGVSNSAGLFNAAARGLDIRIVADKGSTPPATTSIRSWCARTWSTAARSRPLPTSRD